MKILVFTFSALFLFVVWGCSNRHSLVPKGNNARNDSAKSITNDKTAEQESTTSYADLARAEKSRGLVESKVKGGAQAVDNVRKEVRETSYSTREIDQKEMFEDIDRLNAKLQKVDVQLEQFQRQREKLIGDKPQQWEGQLAELSWKMSKLREVVNEWRLARREIRKKIDGAGLDEAAAAKAAGNEKE